MRERYKLKKDSINIGIFGFLSSNKGHSTAIEAIEYLGKNYNLLIFGGQHPTNIDFYEMSDLDNNSEYINNNKYITNLINQIKDYRGRANAAQERSYIETLYSMKTNTEKKELPKQHYYSFNEDNFNIKMLGNLNDENYIKYMSACDFSYFALF